MDGLKLVSLRPNAQLMNIWIIINRTQGAEEDRERGPGMSGIASWWDPSAAALG
jgi:hypothetical protein